MTQQIIPKYHSVQVAQAIKLHVTEWGERSGKHTCVLIHGLAEGSFVWAMLAETLAPSYHVIAVDLKGHGRSEWSVDGNYTFPDLYSELRTLLEVLEIKQPVLIGHSLGGSLAAQLLITGISSAICAIIVDSSPFLNSSATETLRDQIVQGYRAYGSISEYGSWLKETRIFAAPPIIDIIAGEALVERPDHKFWPRFDLKVLGLLKSAEEWSWWPKLLECHRPFFLVRGEASGIFTKKVAKQIAPAVPHKLLTVPMAGHAVMTDNPASFSRIIAKILSSGAMAPRDRTVIPIEPNRPDS